MVMMSPVRATRNPAPADTLILRTVMVKPLGAPRRAGVIREGVLSLGHADGQGAKAQLSELRRLLLGGGGEHHAVAVIDLRYDSGQLVLNGASSS